jgi:[ribosomal protein S5]-alanine N-acetyltransferase
MHTQRLELRPLQAADAVQVQMLFPRWEIVRYLAAKVPWPYPADGAQRYLTDLALPAMLRGQEWHWSLRLRDNPGQLIGVISLFDQPDNNRGYWIGLPWQQQRLMSEAAEAVTGYWFEVLGFPTLRVPKACANEASRRISISQGMRLVATREQQLVSGRLPVEIWEITAAEWAARKARLSSRS